MGRLVSGQRTNRAPRGPLGAGGGGPMQEKIEDYLERVTKYVPVEIVAAYLTIRGLAPAAGSTNAWPAGVELAIFVLVLLATPLYLWRFGGVVPGKAMQVVIGTISFVVWSYGIGGPFFWSQLERICSTRLVYDGLGGGIVILWTLVVGLKRPA